MAVQPCAGKKVLDVRAGCVKNDSTRPVDSGARAGVSFDPDRGGWTGQAEPGFSRKKGVGGMARFVYTWGTYRWSGSSGGPDGTRNPPHNKGKIGRKMDLSCTMEPAD